MTPLLDLTSKIVKCGEIVKSESCFSTTLLNLRRVVQRSNVVSY